MHSTAPTISTIEQFCQRHPAFTLGGIRHIRFHEEENGFAKAFVQIGRRVYVNEEVFFEIALGPQPAPGSQKAVIGVAKPGNGRAAK